MASSNSLIKIPATPSHVLPLRSPSLTANFLHKPFSSSRRRTQHGRPVIKIAAAFQNPFSFDIDKHSKDMKSLVPVFSTTTTSSSSSGILILDKRRKDPNTVFIAGAMGQAGIRIALALLRVGFTVRAGVPDLNAAQDLARLVVTYKVISNEESKRLIAVKSSFQDTAESIAKAVGNAGKVVITLGPSENGPSSAVSVSDALQVVEAAELAAVGHMVIVCDEMTARVGGVSTFQVLDRISTFLGNLFSQSPRFTAAELLRRVAAGSIGYTVIKTSLAEDFSAESGYAMIVSAEGMNKDASKKDYKVPKSQIALLVSQVFSHTEVTKNKVVEVYTHPSAIARPVSEVFSAIPEDERRLAYAEEVARERAEEEAKIAAERAEEAAEAAKKLEEEVKKLSRQEARAASLAREAQQKIANVNARAKCKGKDKDIDWGMALKRFVSPKPSVDEKPKQQQLQDSVKGRTESATETRSILGGLFKQETMHIDDDED